MFPYSDHSPDNESICYVGHWCGSALSVRGMNWSDANVNFVRRLDDVRIWNVTRDEADFDAVDRESAPRIDRAEGTVGSDRVTVTFTEGVFANDDSSGALEASDLIFSDREDGRRITGIAHVAGDASATLVLSSPLDEDDDVGVDTVAAVRGSIHDEHGNASGTDTVVLSPGSWLVSGSEIPPPTRAIGDRNSDQPR